MHARVLCALAGAALSTTLTAQFPPAPAPDILIPDGSVDGVYRFTDRDGNGSYDFTTGEVYDYLVTTSLDVSFRKVAYLNGWLYTTGPKRDKVYKFWDANADGLIDYGTEFSLAMDPALEIAQDASANLLDVVSDGVSLYYTNYSGNNEGIWKLTDSNGDGNFALALGEINGAFVEVASPADPGVASVPTGNAPNTTGLFTVPNELQSMNWDPTISTGSLALGRLLIENEDNNNECTIAFEDKNADGDFYDAGEVYIFLNLCTDSARGAYLDASPAMGAFPAGYNIPYYEIEHVEVDTTGANTVWYAIAEDSTGAVTELGIVFRCQDLNNDADVNDAGECVVWFDGSSDSMLGATNEYKWITGSGIYGGNLYLSLEHIDGLGNVDSDHVITMRDLNGSGAIDQPNEVAVVHRQRNQTMYNLACFAPGFLAAPPAGIAGYYEYVTPVTCFTSLAMSHEITVGTNNWNDKFVVGQTVPIRTFGAIPNTPIALHIGTFIPGGVPLDGPCLYTVDPFIVAGGLFADAAGNFNIGVTVPGALVGLEIYWQWIGVDLGLNAYNVSTTDTLKTVFGTFSFTQNGL